ncbi:unnamed protein product [Pleuronectes platessa]|uniref:Uncharacterized protein n=1 Tax=Pleuronectes platessa TaxID=8262 RepID=A0A9N7VQ48_PLEPL|nr:unnamed protein product [Pleuronectes platessa]
MVEGLKQLVALLQQQCKQEGLMGNVFLVKRPPDKRPYPPHKLEHALIQRGAADVRGAQTKKHGAELESCLWVTQSVTDYPVTADRLPDNTYPTFLPFLPLVGPDGRGREEAVEPS